MAQAKKPIKKPTPKKVAVVDLSPAEAPIEVSTPTVEELANTPQLVTQPLPTDAEVLLTKIVKQYNSLKMSSQQWNRRRNQLRNEWLPLYELLESVSGRDHTRHQVMFDDNFHKIDGNGPEDRWDYEADWTRPEPIVNEA